MGGPTPITPAHETGAFSCRHVSLDDWLKNNALKAEGRTARTYVVTEGPRLVVGYYCLATGAVAREGAPGRVRRNAPDPVPIAVIGRLAVAKHYERRGIGSGMLQDALRRVLQISEAVGCTAVFVHAIDGDACTFYTRFGFVEFPSDSKTLFLPIQTLRAALG